MESQKLWFEITIAGFLYVAAAFFFMLSLIGIHDLCFLSRVRDLLPYISLVVIAVSYCSGLAIDTISHKVIARINNDAYDAKTDIKLLTTADYSLQRRIKFSYATLLLFRHFVLGPTTLAICFTIWLTGTEFRQLWFAVVLPCYLLALLSLVAYHIHIENYDELKNAAKDYVNKKQSELTHSTSDLSQ